MGLSSNTCDICNKKSHIIFICPKCYGRFCKIHRRAEKHQCKNPEKKITYWYYPKPEIREAVHAIKTNERERFIQPVVVMERPSQERTFSTTLEEARTVIMDTYQIVYSIISSN